MAVFVGVFLVAALLIQSRKAESCARLDFLWKFQVCIFTVFVFF